MRSHADPSTVKRRSAGALAVLLLAAGALLAFAELAGEVVEGDTRAFDEAVLLSLRTPADTADPVGPQWVEAAFRDLTTLGGTSVLTVVTLATLGYLLLGNKRATAALVAFAVLGGTLLSTLLKAGFERPRPDLVAHLVEVSSQSFPSGHAMLSTVTWLTLGTLLATVQPTLRLKAYVLGVGITIALLVGVSRVYLGVHWPTDVIAGWCIGAAWALLCWLAAGAGRGAGFSVIRLFRRFARITE
ncbi:MAG TPA: phosphatase PAP2 family protein [Steroidobacteraceae bacterium]|nr:phosphatase PAP2 family protein [Steroidobacteraceae bacterium]